MSVLVSFLGEGDLAEATLEGLLAGVGAKVHLKLLLSEEAFLAEWTWKAALLLRVHYLTGFYHWAVWGRSRGLRRRVFKILLFWEGAKRQLKIGTS